MYTYTEIIQIKLNSLGYPNKVTGFITKAPDFSSDSRIAIANFNRNTGYNNGAYIDKTFLVNLDNAYKKKFPDKPLPNSYFEGWSKQLVYGSGNAIIPEIVPDNNDDTNIIVKPESKNFLDTIPKSIKLIGGGIIIAIIINKLNQKKRR